jgi:hypothetical protein
MNLTCLWVFGLGNSVMNHRRGSDVLAGASEVGNVLTIADILLVNLTRACVRAACGWLAREPGLELGLPTLQFSPLGLQVDASSPQALGTFALVCLLLRRCELGQRMVIAASAATGSDVGVTTNGGVDDVHHAALPRFSHVPGMLCFGARAS